MLVTTLPVEKSLYARGSGTPTFITLNAPNWLKKIQEILGIAFFSTSVGELNFGAIEYHTEGGLKPYSGELESIPALLLLFTHALGDRPHFLSKMEWTPSVLQLSKPQSIKLETETGLYPLTGHDCYLVNIDIAATAPRASLSSYDPFSTFKRLSLNTKALYELYQAHNPFGTCRNIKQVHIDRACKSLFDALPHLAIDVPDGIKIVAYELATHEKVYFYFHRDTRQLEPIFPIIKNQSKGSYKQVHQMLGISENPKCYAHLVCSADKTSEKAELFYRRYVLDKGISIPEYANWTEDQKLHILSDWASFGRLNLSLDSLSRLGIEVRDTMVLQLLDKLNRLHTKAVHCDFNSSNILHHKTKTAEHELSITDFGTWGNKDPKNFYGSKIHLSTIKTHSSNLAPELLLLCSNYYPLCYWRAPFEVKEGISFDHWVLSERWVLARMIAHIYLGFDLYEKSISDEILAYQNEHYPFSYVSFDEAYADPNCLRKLFNFLDYKYHENYEDQLKQLQIYQTSLKAASSAFASIPFEFIDTSFEQVLENPELFYKLHEELLKFVNMKDLYAKAYETAQDSLVLEKMGLVSSHIIRERPSFLSLIETFDSIPPDIKDRLLLLAPLFDFDPVKRPALSEIHALLEALVRVASGGGGGAAASGGGSGSGGARAEDAPAHGGAGVPS